MIEPAPATRPVVSQWLARRATLMALLGRSGVRRDRMALLLTTVRGMLGWGTLALGALLAVGGGAAAWFGARTPADAYTLLCLLAVGGAVITATAMFSTEQRSGTLELLWLACGSERAMLMHKLVAALVILALLLIPAAVGLSLFLDTPLPAVQFAGWLAVSAWLALTAVALLATWLPQAWAATLVGAAVFAGVYVSIGQVATMFNPFLNPLAEGAGKVGISNRILFVILGWFFFTAAAGRLRRLL